MNLNHADKDLITLDFSLNQIRFLRNNYKGEFKPIVFLDLNAYDFANLWGYYKNCFEGFKDEIAELLFDFKNIEIEPNKLSVVNTQGLK